jgi:hypothetical protein
MPRLGEVAEPLHGHAVLGRGPDQIVLGPVGNVGDDVEPGGDPADLGGGHVVGERLDEPVAPAPVGEPGPADVPVVGTVGDELGEGELVEGAGKGAPGPLDRDEVIDQGRRHDEPGEPEARREALRRRSCVDDLVGREGLHRPDRLPVVPELTVVVVLEHDRPGLGRPSDRVPPASRIENDADRELVGRRQQRRRGIAALVDAGPAFVHRYWSDGEAAALDDVPMEVVPERLHRDRRRARASQPGANQFEPLGEPGANDDPGRVDGDPTGPGEVPGQRVTKLRDAAGIAIAERPIGRHREGASGGGEPLRPGECREVRSARTEVEPDRPLVAPTHRRRTGLMFGSVGNPRAGTVAGDEPSLGDELGEGIGDGVAPDTELFGECPRRGQPGSGLQAAGTDRLAQLVFEAEPDLSVVQTEG